MQKYHRIIRIIGATLLGASLIACGGGGETGTGTPNPGAGSGSGVSSAPQTIVTFTPSNAAFPNPERGFMRPAAGPASGIRGGIEAYAKEGLRLVHYRADLSNYRGSATLDEGYKNSLRQVFELFREKGVKTILRFSYSPTGNEPDAPLAIVKSHIQQLGPILKENEDVIALVEAGFIGPWGEWYRSDNDLTKPENKIAIRDQLLDAVPASRQLSIRRPDDMMKWYPNDPTVSDLLAAAPKPAARIGFHNDCFLADAIDLTYTDPEKQRPFTRSRTAYTASGGETCTPQRQARMTCADILREGAEYHMAYLNKAYHLDFIKAWESGGCFAEVSNKLGYRLQLEEAGFTASGAAGQSISWSVRLRNVGWARPMNARSLVLRLQGNAGNHYDVTLPGSNLREAGAGEQLSLSGSAVLPKGIPSGRYNLLLGAPDPSSRLSADPRFSIRFANADANGVRWDSEQGFMWLGTTFDVK